MRIPFFLGGGTQVEVTFEDTFVERFVFWGPRHPTFWVQLEVTFEVTFHFGTCYSASSFEVTFFFASTLLLEIGDPPVLWVSRFEATIFILGPHIHKI